MALVAVAFALLSLSRIGICFGDCTLHCSYKMAMQINGIACARSCMVAKENSALVADRERGTTGSERILNVNVCFFAMHSDSILQYQVWVVSGHHGVIL